MPVSQGLQKYFDSQGKGKKKHIKEKLKQIEGQIDPAFMQSFESFHDRILGIVGDDETSLEVVSNELSKVDMKLRSSRRKHDLKKAASIIRAGE